MNREREIAKSSDDAVKLWQFHRQILWSRIQTATVIEGATLGGWYKILGEHHAVLAGAILVFGAALLIAATLLMFRDGQYIEACEKAAMGRIPMADALLPEGLTTHLPILHRFGGRMIVGMVFLFMAALDIVLALHPHLLL